MPATKERPAEYSEIRAKMSKTDKRCCGPIAVAIVCGVTGRRAQNAMALFGRQRGRGSQTYQILGAVKAFGFEVRELTKHPITKCKTVRTLGKNTPKRGTFLVFTARHVLAVKDGVVQDWTDGRLHRITAIYRVEK